jgi:hypothetical protein
MEFSKDRFVSIGVTKAMLSVWNIYRYIGNRSSAENRELGKCVDSWNLA